MKPSQVKCKDDLECVGVCVVLVYVHASQVIGISTNDF